MKKFAALLALIMLTAFSFLPVHDAESGRGGCTHWYDVSITPIQYFDNGDILMHSTMTRQCKGTEETVVHCFITDEWGVEYTEVPCPAGI